ncbi:UDP-glucose 4-epimerase GalE [Kineococcus indalonis]|uniref:UDP-glucose 4-epimerase GalE n=1 Tax=Kineococcus indalonis TaxID=2696566 RepID=UPI00141219AD|nr:UDP-glucose 4-epimerase GalE [Kineococcus indalonis]NAZ86418.1 UDP-glucose 4-epimerase GalE [Kineococcus indalonis]
MTGTRWLITGGAGYVGAHVVRAVLASGREAVVVDDLSTGARDRVPAGVAFLDGSVTDASFLTGVLQAVRPDGVVHLAAKKSPTESVSDPLRYARENVGGVTALATAALAAGVERIVFSSSCSVYGTPDVELVREDAPLLPQSPYGDSKLYGERLLAAAARAHGTGLVSLRYFNVAGTAEPALADTGAHNLVPLALRALRSGTSPVVFGDDYPTPDGTCVRDYVHVEDLAEAHVRAAAALELDLSTATYNVGRGEGSSVLEVLDALRRASGRDVAHEVRERRPGDPARVVGSTERIEAELGWRARRDLDEMVSSAWRAAER